MERVKIFFSKYGLYAFIFMCLLLFMRTCSKNRRIHRLENANIVLNNRIDSLTALIPSEENTKLLIWKAEYGVYNKLNNEMSKLNRQEQLMQFQNSFIIPQLEDLNDKIQ
jgi:hypothetical protein